MSGGQPFLGGRVVLHPGDCRDVLAGLAANSVDAIVTDPPYALVSIVKRFGAPGAAATKDGDVYARASAGFMGQQWDTGETAFAVAFWQQCLRVLKPGGHVAAFSGTRTYHRLAVAIEDAGFEIRDQLGWAYASGFPKSHNVGKAIDRAMGMEREGIRIPADQVRNPKVIDGGHGVDGGDRPFMKAARERGFHEAASPEAAAYVDHGTALKPAWEPIVLARKPLAGTVARNVLAHGTGALNIGGCRVPWADAADAADTADAQMARKRQLQAQIAAGGAGFQSASIGRESRDGTEPVAQSPLGRWPANIVHDGSEAVREVFPDGAHRFFFSAKADALDRAGSRHPTVKPVDLMQWLCRLIVPKGGLVLDPFAGSGTTGEAAWREGMRAILVEREPQFLADIAARLSMAETPAAAKAHARAARKPVAALPLFGDDGVESGGGGRLVLGRFARDTPTRRASKDEG